MGDMDSVNSGSIHSSSTGGGGDDQEFDSRSSTIAAAAAAAFGGDSMTSFFHNTVPFHHQVNSYNTNTFTLPTFSPSYNNNNNNINDYNNNNSNSNNINDLGMVWPEKYNSIIKPSIYSSPVENDTGFNPTQNAIHTQQRVSTGTSPGPTEHPGPGGGGRNPKKRSRASRRAPTTVLTTDTNNFRQMVQEFTGIPAPPFSGRTRLDLFGGLGIPLPRSSVSHLGGGRSLLDVSNSELLQQQQQQQQQQMSFVLRPFPHKIVPNNSQPFIPECSNNNLPMIGPNATRSIMNEFALGHATATTAATEPATRVDGGNIRMSSALQRQVVNACDADVGGNICNNNNNGVNAGTSLGNHGRSSEGMMDNSWICSSSSN
ncbi:hypothetical protein vseg_019355 [Gypsophila vaccaria]